MGNDDQKLTIDTKLYRDERGKLKKTKSGHYRFDLLVKRGDKAFASILGLRFDLGAVRILPVTIPMGGGIYTVAEIAPGSHDHVASLLAALISRELEEEALIAKGGY